MTRIFAPRSCVGLVSCLILLTGTPAAARPAKDLLYFKNGDKWTCEIKKLEAGYLYVGLDYVDGTVNVDWRRVSGIESSQPFVVTDTNGVVHVGAISATPAGAAAISGLTIGAGVNALTIPREEIASIQQTGKTFWQEIHGGLGMGFNYAKGDNNTQYNLNASMTFVKRQWIANAQFQSSFSGSLSTPNDLHNDLTIYGLRMLNTRKLVAVGISDFLKSDEQQLALRTTLGAGLGKILTSTEASRIVLVGGAAFTRSRYEITDSPIFNNADVFGGLILDYFRFKSTNINVTAFLYPGVTDRDRVQMDGKASFRRQLVKNLYVNFSLYVNYDSKPPLPTAKSDFGATTSVSWSY